MSVVPVPLSVDFGPSMSVVPVFLYHAVADDSPPWLAPFTVSPRTFVGHLDMIAASGLHVVPLRQLVAALLGGPSVPPRSAVLTFDDGYTDFASTVAPLLLARGLPATLYVTTGALRAAGRPSGGGIFPSMETLSWAQVRELDAAGIEIGGHSIRHPQLDTLPRKSVREEVAGCKRQIEDELGHAVDSFAYPHGYSSRAVRRVVREVGWTSAAAIRAASALSSERDDPLRFARLMVRADTGRERFVRWTGGEGAPVAPFAESLRTRGWRAYRRARAVTGRPYRALPA
ncbi:polysaccharide deacetylase family protein [Streptomyces sp. HUCO-GS316]|uniref:polysaccharide deacetylase family protein n=1 Tax=Streptomyces sp. HUCO-GS316 TaxID=2692198 RepID=UPI00136D9D02|nr:polysaccharide deacetylase family protein [Streptomyces sp. HUCO-GS316]MXM64514.1 polysaccharide deacetylase family protein [Streptomyces sp. HUCO-GS316]